MTISTPTVRINSEINVRLEKITLNTCFSRLHEVLNKPSKFTLHIIESYYRIIHSEPFATLIRIH